MKVVIRADGSSEMGYGHLTRSNAIASELIGCDDSVVYLTKTPNTVASVCNKKVEIELLNGGRTKEIASKLRQIGADIVFIDLPEIPVKLQRGIRDVCPVAVYLGSAREQLDCDLLINGHPFAKEENYEWSGREPTWLLGPEYLPLREPFPKIATWEKECRKDVQNGIILMGGTDPHNITPRVMKSFEPLEMDVDVVVGPGSEHLSAVEREAASLSSKFNIVVNPDDLPDRMFSADLAVSGFGTTTYELMATRTPFVGITRTDVEELTANRMADHVNIVHLGKGFNQNQLTTILNNLKADHHQRKNLQRRYKEIIDGKGSERIVKQMRRIVM